MQETGYVTQTGISRMQISTVSSEAKPVAVSSHANCLSANRRYFSSGLWQRVDVNVSEENNSSNFRGICFMKVKRVCLCTLKMVVSTCEVMVQWLHISKVLSPLRPKHHIKLFYFRVCFPHFNPDMSSASSFYEVLSFPHLRPFEICFLEQK